MLKEEPFISIITLTYNSEAFIEKTIISVRNQSYNNYEHIFIDGGSTDSTLDLIRKYSGDCVLVSEPDNGISDAFNKGIKLAQGELIGIINSDDYYADNIFMDVVAAYIKSGRNKIIHGNICIFSERNKRHIKPRPFPDVTFYIDMPVYHPTVFVPKSIYDEVGLFDTSCRFAMDFDFLLRAWQRGVRFHQLDNTISYFRTGGAANSNTLLVHREVLNSQLKNGLNPILCHSTYIAKVIVNRIKKLFLAGNG